MAEEQTGSSPVSSKGVVDKSSYRNCGRSLFRVLRHGGGNRQTQEAIRLGRLIARRRAKPRSSLEADLEFYFAL